MRSAPSPVAEVAFDRAQAAVALQKARWLYDMREKRGRVLGASLFAEPAWDLLLDLYISRADGRALSITAACIGSRASTATAIRYVGLLCGEGIIQRRADGADHRRSFVELTDKGANAMTALLLN